MNARGVAFVLVTTALVACRAVLGIEDQTIEDGPTRDGGPNPPGDARPPGDADTDAGKPGTKPPPTQACVGTTGGECLKCCRDRNPPGNAVLDQALAASCLCNGEGLCKTPCASDLCGGGNPGAPGSACLNCVTQNTLAPACDDAFAACRANASCAATADCIEGTCE